MACFLVPLGEAVVLTVAKKLAFKKNADSVIKARLGNLEKMLYGGSFMLATEHVYHGEVVFYPPFLTAMKNPVDTREMLHEMATEVMADHEHIKVLVQRVNRKRHCRVR